MPTDPTHVNFEYIDAENLAGALSDAAERVAALKGEGREVYDVVVATTTEGGGAQITLYVERKKRKEGN
jgi:hypothetical protein